ncbi:dihydrodipicolinate synthase family protein [Mycobacterium yunnanensis]|uniref:Dihydrodipicolinate synthase family protein n=1 Tax=Mycobacterium yunnanensis TaxID=368477 RepID=A0A9X2YJW3_9MYCO|nr:dihydrodipicolinate synthase family protein [Mycobacterium yunnanensis]MCV7420733.1 dihydrodipicolinate synthase family protein [Mycobacterium yunnanensis]
MTQKPWHGIVVASTLPFTDDLSVDYDRFQQHVRYLADNGVDGITPNGSLGEYQVLTAKERARVVEAAVEAAPEGFSVIPGVGAYGSAESLRWTEQAQAAGADAVLALPPNSYRASDDEVVAHYREVAKAGLPIVAYNNPFDTRIDLTAELLSRVAEIDQVVAVKEFSGDIRRITSIQRLAPQIDVLSGADDNVFEATLLGAVGWIGGFSNALPQQCAKIYEYGTTGQVEKGRALYAHLQAAFFWDTTHQFVQAIKLAQDVAGGYGGPCRAPRGPLPDDVREQVVKDVEQALAATL